MTEPLPPAIHVITFIPYASVLGPVWWSKRGYFDPPHNWDRTVPVACDVQEQRRGGWGRDGQCSQDLGWHKRHIIGDAVMGFV